jgi:hypothetical protein
MLHKSTDGRAKLRLRHLTDPRFTKKRVVSSKKIYKRKDKHENREV